MIFAGVTTNVCVETTMRSAVDEDYLAMLVADACAAYDEAEHSAAVTVLGRHFGAVTTTGEVRSRWGTTTCMLIRNLERGRSRDALSPRDRLAGQAALGLAGVLTLVVAFELAPRLGVVDARFLPPFTEMAAAMAERAQTAQFWTALRQTLTTWAVGLGIAVVAGVVLGMVIGSAGILRSLTASTIEFLRPIPSVALIPLAVLLLGTGMQSTLLLVVYASFWQMLVQVLYGVQDVDPVAHDTARSYRFRVRPEGYRLVWPTVLPYAMTGFRLAAAVRDARSWPRPSWCRHPFLTSSRG